MKVNVEDVSPVQKRMTVELPVETVSKAYATVYNQFRKNASIRGFRKGKAPNSILAREYGPQIKGEVLEKLIQESISDAITKADVIMVLEPQLEDAGDLNERKPFTYSVLMDIVPDFEVGEYKGIKLVKPAVEVTDEEVEEQLQALRRHFGSIAPMEENRPVGENDIVIVDYTAEVDGEEIDELAQEDFYVEVGAGNFNEEFEKALVGMSKGDEKDIEIAYPDDAANAKVAGKTITYHVTVKDIQERELPDLDDEFAKRIGAGFETIDDVRKRLREQIQKDKEEAVQSSLRNQLFDALLQDADFPVPDRLVEKKLDQMIDNIAGHMQERGVDLERAGLDETRLREKMRDDAVKQVRTELILDKIAEIEDISIPNEELQGYAQYIESNYQDMNVKRSDLQSAVFDTVLPKLRAQKTVEFLLKESETVDANAEENEAEAAAAS